MLGGIRKEKFFRHIEINLSIDPKNSIFVPKDYRDFHMSIIPADGIKVLPLIWQFLCEDYQKEGFLTINVEPIIEERAKTIMVNDEAEIKPDEISVVAKIIEE